MDKCAPSNNYRASYIICWEISPKWTLPYVHIMGHSMYVNFYISCIKQINLVFYLIQYNEFNGLVQDCSISIANAMEILQSCTKPLNLLLLLLLLVYPKACGLSICGGCIFIIALHVWALVISCQQNAECLRIYYMSSRLCIAWSVECVVYWFGWSYIVWSS